MSKYNKIERLRIRDLRKDCDKTQKEIAELLNMQLTTYREYENQERRIPADFLIRIAKLYNVSIDYIAGLTNDKRGIGYNFNEIQEEK